MSIPEGALWAVGAHGAPGAAPEGVHEAGGAAVGVAVAGGGTVVPHAGQKARPVGKAVPHFEQKATDMSGGRSIG
jgi:hypothetical protein